MKYRLSALYLPLLLSASAASAAVLTDNNHQVFIDPETLRIAVADTTVSRGTEKQPVSDLTEYPRRVSWFWPDRDMNVTAVLNDTDLTLTFTTNQPQNFQWFTLPDNTVSALYMPLGEGRHIPLNNEQWRHYMVTEQDNIDTNQDLQLPLWSQQQDRVYSWVLLSPFHNRLHFEEKQQHLQMSAVHQFNRFNQQQPFTVLLHTGDTPLDGALRYRRWLQDNKQFTSLEEKFAQIPDGKKLIGATHVYLWGKSIIDQQDITDWPGLVRYLQSPAGNGLWQAMEPQSRDAFAALNGKTPEKWQQPFLADALNQALKKVTPLSRIPDDSDFMAAQKKQAQAIRSAVKQQLSPFLAPEANWGQGLSLPLLTALTGAKLDKLWLGTDNWTATWYQPQAVSYAKEHGYLIASYDSYDTAIPAGKNTEWLTAQIPSELREKCAIVTGTGRKLPGFGGDGYYLNPGCMQDFSEKRMTELVQLTGINSLFLDVDGTGMVSDDYNPASPASADAMAAARNNRLRSVAENIRIPLGSEDGNAVTAQYLMFAHGTETRGFGWSDADIHRNKQSPYYLGAWWPENEPAIFFTPGKLKDIYLTTEFDPRWRLPLYQAVFHDAVITTHHWTLDNLKFPAVTTTRELLSQLYNTPPLYNLSRNTVQKRLPAMIKSDSIFRPLHQQLWNKALTGFRWLDSDGLLQQTQFSDGSVITVNFADHAIAGYPPHSLSAIPAEGKPVNTAF